MDSLRAHLTRRHVAPALVLVLSLALAGAVGESRHITPIAAASSGSESDTPSPPPSLALRPGARLAPARILDFYSTPLALNYVITDQDAAPPDHSTAAPHASRTPDQGSDDAPGTASAETSASTAPSRDAGPATASPSSAASSASTGTYSPAPADAGHAVSVYSLTGVLALLIAAITAALALRRTRQRSKAGHRTRRDTDTAPTTEASPTADGPEGVVLLDAALRTMAHHNAQLPQPASLPTIRGALIGTTVQVLPEDLTTEPPAPFTPGDHDTWELPEDADLLDAETAEQIPAPYPALATLGTTDNSELLLLNLTSLPALLLDGNPQHIGEVCTALTVELATSPWSENLELITVGCGTDLAALLPTVRITHAPDAPHALRETSERLLEAHQSPDAHRRPLVVLCASPADPETVQQFADLHTAPAARPLTLIAPADTTAHHFPDAPVLDASLDQAQYLEYLDARVTLQRLPQAGYQEISSTLRNAAATPFPHSAQHGTWQDNGRSPDQSEQTPQTNSSEPLVSSASAGGNTSNSDGVFPALLTALRSTGTHPAHGTSPAPSHQQGSQTDDSTSARQAAAPGMGPAQPARGRSSQSADTGLRVDFRGPHIRVLGPVEVDGVDAGGHGPRIAQLAALLYFKPGRTADTLCTDMDPARPWSATTLNARLHGLRSALGKDPTGRPYVPRRKTGDDPYHLHPAITCDWTHFQHLTQHPTLEGPDRPVHVEQLEEALTLVRGTPFNGRPLPWAEPLQQEMTTAITEVAHSIATHRMSPGPHHDLDKARHAVSRGIDINGTAEILYRDWILVEEAAGNRHGVHTAISRIQHINRTLSRPLEEATEHLINTLIGHARHT